MRETCAVRVRVGFHHYQIKAIAYKSKTRERFIVNYCEIIVKYVEIISTVQS